MGSIDKQRSIIDFTLSSLWRRKGKNGALLCVYTLMVFLLASVMFLAAAIRQEAAAVLSEAPELVVQRLMAGRHDLVPESYRDRIRTMRGVSDVQARLWGYYYDPSFRANFTVQVPQSPDFSAGSCVIGAQVAARTGSEAGGLLPFRTATGRWINLEIERVLPSTVDPVAADLVLVTAADFRAIFGVPEGHATDLTVEVANLAEVSTVAKKIAALFPDARPIARDEVLATYDAVFAWRSGIVLVVFCGALAAFIIFAWDKASGLSAEERREIGVLKAVGWDTADVLTMKFWEGCAVSLTSFLTGTILAYLHVCLAGAPLLAPVLQGWSVLRPELDLRPTVEGSTLTVLFFLTVVPYTVACIVPAWRAATVDPDAVLRG